MSQQLAQLEKRNRQLQDRQQLSELGEIAKGFAHSLRNPLNTLGLAVDELATEKINDERKQALQQIVLRQISRIDQWIKSFMALNDDNENLSRLSLNLLIEDLVLEFKSTHPEIHWMLDLSSEVEIEGLETELNTILQVVLENALEASSDQQPIQVILFQDRESEQIYCRIIDLGDGINPEIAEQVFSPKVSSKRNGAGMGLFLARRLARARYQGDIQLISNTKGTTAELTLSFRRDSL